MNSSWPLFLNCHAVQHLPPVRTVTSSAFVRHRQRRARKGMNCTGATMRGTRAQLHDPPPGTLTSSDSILPTASASVSHTQGQLPSQCLRHSTTARCSVMLASNQNETPQQPSCLSGEDARTCLSHRAVGPATCFTSCAARCAGTAWNCWA